MLVTTGKGRDEVRKAGHIRDLKICDSLLDAAEYIVAGSFLGVNGGSREDAGK